MKNEWTFLQCLSRPFRAMALTMAIIAMLFTSSGACHANSDLTSVAVVQVIPTISFGVDASTQMAVAWYAPLSLPDTHLEYVRSIEGTGMKKADTLTRKITTDKDTRYVCRAELSGLFANTHYSYQVVDKAGNPLASGSFKTAPLKGKQLEPWTFLQLTDTQGANAKDYMKWGKTLDAALQRFPDARFIALTGDVVDRGSKMDHWDWFSKGGQLNSANLPIEAAVGNHDVLNTNGTNRLVRNFTDRFALPKLENTGAVSGTAYAFDYGQVHFVVLNSEGRLKSLKAQAQWLKQDLEKNHQRWTVVALHRGPYGATSDSVDVRKIWGPIFDAYGVDLVLQGHEHNYLRSFPMKGEKPVGNGKGTVYIAANTAGVKYYPLKSRSWQAVDLQPKKPLYVAVTVTQDALKVTAYDVEGRIWDGFELKK